IRPCKSSESIRFLGVWINIKKHRRFVISQAKDEVLSLCNYIRHKRITDKQLLYLYNMVILPKIEYRTQLTYLSQFDCDSIIVPFRKVFKHRLHMAISMPNAILDNHLIYRFRNLWDVQNQSKITNFTIQLNDNGLLGTITDIRLKQLQFREWLKNTPLFDWPYDIVPKKFYSSYLAFMISLCRKSEITFNISHSHMNSIFDGKLELRHILPDFAKHMKQLQLRNIMFLEQLTSINGLHLST